MLGLTLEYNQQTRTMSEEAAVDDGRLEGEVIQIDTQCSACSAPGTVNMHKTNIPYFKEVVIMAFKCDLCGYKTNEIKSGGEISPKGLRLQLVVTKPDDLKRDVLKSDTASLKIPEIELELAPGTLGGFFSSIEGTLVQVRDQLANLPELQFGHGDSANPDERSQSTAMAEFLEKIDGLLTGEKTFTFILDDPLGNVYIQNPRKHLPPPQDVDEFLTREEYERSWEQDEDLGLHDMNC
jgi:zinc finger protein